MDYRSLTIEITDVEWSAQDHGWTVWYHVDPDADADDQEALAGFVAARYEVCQRCHGRGTHDHPAFSNGITASEWAEWDQDEREAYHRGAYSVTCTECRGRAVVPTVDLGADPDKADALALALADHQEADARYQREVDAERMWEARMLYGASY